MATEVPKKLKPAKGGSASLWWSEPFEDNGVMWRRLKATRVEPQAGMVRIWAFGGIAAELIAGQSIEVLAEVTDCYTVQVVHPLAVGT